MTDFISAEDTRYDDRARALVRIGKVGIATEDDAALDAYFAEGFRFHGPGAELGYPELKAFFAGMRAAFTDFACERQAIVTQGDLVGCLTTMSGKFDSRFEMSPIGPVEPNGNRISFQLVNMFRYDADGRLAEEWVQYDTLDFLRQLGVEMTPATDKAAA